MKKNAVLAAIAVAAVIALSGCGEVSNAEKELENGITQSALDNLKQQMEEHPNNDAVADLYYYAQADASYYFYQNFGDENDLENASTYISKETGSYRGKYKSEIDTLTENINNDKAELADNQETKESIDDPEYLDIYNLTEDDKDAVVAYYDSKVEEGKQVLSNDFFEDTPNEYAQKKTCMKYGLSGERIDRMRGKNYESSDWQDKELIQSDLKAREEYKNEDVYSEEQLKMITEQESGYNALGDWEAFKEAMKSEDENDYGDVTRVKKALYKAGVDDELVGYMNTQNILNDIADKIIDHADNLTDDDKEYINQKVMDARTEYNEYNDMKK